MNQAHNKERIKRLVLEEGPLTRDEMSEYVGIHKENIGNWLRELEDDGEISVKKTSKPYEYAAPDYWKEVSDLEDMLKEELEEEIEEMKERNQRLYLRNWLNLWERWRNREYGKIPVRLARELDMHEDSREFKNIFASVERKVSTKVWKKNCKEWIHKEDEIRKERMKEEFEQLVKCECGAVVHKESIGEHFDEFHDGNEMEYEKLEVPEETQLSKRAVEFLEAIKS